MYWYSNSTIPVHKYYIKGLNIMIYEKGKAILKPIYNFKASN